MWTWDQSAGTMTRGKSVFRGYSGRDAGKNNPALQRAAGIGPIPQGRWTIGAPYASRNTGPYTLPITACDGTDTCGRSAFRIHGDSIASPGTASHGCIILPRLVREAVWNSGDHDLLVVE